MRATEMTPRERWLAAMKLEEVDRLLFWPKILSNYAEEQQPPFNRMNLDEVHEWIGSDGFKYVKRCTKVARRNSGVSRVRIDPTTEHTTFKVGSRELLMVKKYDPYTESWHPVDHPVKTKEDIGTMADFFRDVESVLDESALEENRTEIAEIGDSALTGSCVGTTPLMDFVQTLAGIEFTHYLINDHPDEVEELFEAMQELNRQSSRIHAEHSPVDVLFFNENTSTTLISPDQFRRYSYRHLNECLEILNEAGRLSYLHMCGLLKALLPDLSMVPTHGFEAFTSPTLGNTTLFDGRSTCSDKCLIGGTNAFTWTRPTREIIAGLERDLEALPHHRGIAVTSAGRMPNHIAPGKIREVCEWVHAYPARM